MVVTPSAKDKLVGKEQEKQIEGVKKGSPSSSKKTVILANQRYSEKTEGESQLRQRSIYSEKSNFNADIVGLSNRNRRGSNESSVDAFKQGEDANSQIRRPFRVYRGGTKHRRRQTQDCHLR